MTRNITVQLLLVNSIVMVMLLVLSIELMKSEEETRPVVDTLSAAAYLLLGFATCVDVIDYLRTAWFSVEYNFDTPRSFLYNAAAIVTEGVVKRVTQSLERVNLQADGKALPLTVSSGVAAGAGGTQSFAALLKQADQALYRAKQAGRNRHGLDENGMWTGTGRGAVVYVGSCKIAYSFSLRSWPQRS